MNTKPNVPPGRRPPHIDAFLRAYPMASKYRLVCPKCGGWFGYIDRKAPKDFEGSVCFRCHPPK